MRPSNFSFLFTLFAFLFTNINLQAQDLASAETARTTMIEHIMKGRPVLVNLLTTAGLVPALSGDSPYTLFAPPESELKALQNEPADRIRMVMAGHIVKGKYNEKDLKDGAKLEALNGETITICHKKSTLVNGVSIAKPDTELKNGVIHGISSTLAY
ncbi:fasciclin domain-containing protein [Pontibacter sp. KCTC 32443]|uniref:fasciclin domain-containing protein n=1 Tax=Pontibacter TaxID=323449 RepID=UPI00164ED7DA|nr:MULTISPECIES: fasciclin domain-containing protein [Pontibacter]MBC5774561.1 fasciclin domain-containing protein [Pontibacter sp. KCTC 32443]